MVPWTHWREPRLGRLLTEWTSEFTVFNLVIRLGKVKQSALFRVSPVVVVGLNYWPLLRGTLLFLHCSRTDSRETSCFQFCSRDGMLSQHHTNRYQDMLPGVVPLFFLVLSVRSTSRAPN